MSSSSSSASSSTVGGPRAPFPVGTVITVVASPTGCAVTASCPITYTGGDGSIHADGLRPPLSTTNHVDWYDSAGTAHGLTLTNGQTAGGIQITWSPAPYDGTWTTPAPGSPNSESYQLGSNGTVTLTVSVAGVYGLTLAGCVWQDTHPDPHYVPPGGGFAPNPAYGRATLLTNVTVYALGSSSSSSSSSSSGSSHYPSSTSANIVSGPAFARDAHRRPLFADARGPSSSGGSSFREVHLRTTKDAGHTYDDHLCLTAPASAADPNLLVDPYLNLVRLVYHDGAQIVTALAQLDGERGDWGPPSALATHGAAITGRYPACAPHPTDRRAAAMAYLNGGALMTANCYDGGKTWAANTAPVDAGLDFTLSGRAGVCWLGEWLFCFYAKPGAGLVGRGSPDRGQTWGAATTVEGAAPSLISAQAHQGALHVLATAGGSVTLFSSANLGATWTPRVCPAGAAPPLGLLPNLGRLLLGTTQVSDTDGRDWRAAP